MPGTSDQYPMTPFKKVDDLAADERAKRGKYLQAVWKYFAGEHKKPLKVRPGQPDDNILLNMCKIVIERAVAMLFGSGLNWQIANSIPDQDKELALAYLKLVWNGGLQTGGKKQITLNDIATTGHVSGTGMVKIIPPVDPNGYPRILPLDPANVVPFWNENDLEDALWYTIYGKKTRQDIVKVEAGDGSIDWLIRDFKQNRGTRWELVGEGLFGHPWPPVLIWKNLPNPNKFFGMSDLDEAELNDAINFVASNVNRILAKFAHPKTIVKGADLDDIVVDEVGGLITLPKDAEAENLEMASDLQSSMAFFKELQGAFMSLSASVDLTMLRDKIGEITNFGLSILYKDAVDRLTIRRALYGDAIIEINRRLLDLGGFGDNMETALFWPKALPTSDVETVEVVERKRGLGVISLETAAREVGEDWTKEQALIAQEEQGDE